MNAVPWTAGAPVRLGSREHYGWPEAPHVVGGVHPGASSDAEFLQVRRRYGERGLFLRQRFGTLDWSTAEAAEIQVGAWPGDTLPDGAPFTPSTRNPESWLYVVPTGPGIGEQVVLRFVEEEQWRAGTAAGWQQTGARDDLVVDLAGLGRCYVTRADAETWSWPPESDVATRVTTGPGTPHRRAWLRAD